MVTTSETASTAKIPAPRKAPVVRELTPANTHLGKVYTDSTEKPTSIVLSGNVLVCPSGLAIYAYFTKWKQISLNQGFGSNKFIFYHFDFRIWRIVI